MANTPFRVKIYAHQLPQVKRQAKLLATSFERYFEVKISKANQVNFFAKLLGYSSFASLEKQCVKKGSTEPLYILQGELQVSSLIIKFIELAQPIIIKEKGSEYSVSEDDAVEVFECLPARYTGFDLHSEGKEHYSVAHLDLFITLNPDGVKLMRQDCPEEWFEDSRLMTLKNGTEINYLDQKFSHIQSQLFDELKKSVPSLKGGVIFFVPSLDWRDEDLDFDETIISYQKLMNDSNESRQLLLGCEETTFRIHPDNTSDTESAPSPSVIRCSFILLLNTSEPLPTTSLYMTETFEDRLVGYIDANSDTLCDVLPIFCTLKSEPFARPSPKGVYSQYESYSETFFEQYLSDRESAGLFYTDNVAYEIKRYLASHTHVRIEVQILDFYNDDECWPCGIAFLSNEKNILVLTDFGNDGPGSLELSLLDREWPECLKEPEVFFENDGAWCLYEYYTEIEPVRRLDQITKTYHTLMDDVYPAIYNQMSNKIVFGFTKSEAKNTIIPWSDIDTLVKMSVTNVVVDCYCNHRDIEAFFVLSFLSEKKLVAQCAHSIVRDDKKTQHRLEIYKMIEKLSGQFKVKTVSHESRLPNYNTEDRQFKSDPFGYTPYYLAQGQGMLSFDFTLHFNETVRFDNDALSEINNWLPQLCKRPYAESTVEAGKLIYLLEPCCDDKYFSDQVPAIRLMDAINYGLTGAVYPLDLDLKVQTSGYSKKWRFNGVVYIDWMSENDLMLPSSNIISHTGKNKSVEELFNMIKGFGKDHDDDEPHNGVLEFIKVAAPATANMGLIDVDVETASLMRILRDVVIGRGYEEGSDFLDRALGYRQSSIKR